MLKNYVKEEVIFREKIPALIKYQKLEGLECSVPLHWHGELELNLMLDGTGEFTVNGVKSVIGPGDMILINSEDMHMGEPPSSIPLSDRKLELITLLWNRDFLAHYTDGSYVLRFDLALCSRDELAQIAKMVREIGDLYREGGFCYEMDISALFLQIGSRLMRHCLVKEALLPERGQKSAIEAIQQAVRFVDEHCTEPLTLEDAAAQAGFAPAYFSRKFRQSTGITYKEYLGMRRLRGAVRDLLSTGMTINEIALENGFPNVKSFIELFKREYGMTPQKYRNR